jgi:DNA-binding SARP family transcriptional activator/DNA-binding transcriptional ArsR family regulator
MSGLSVEVLGPVRVRRDGTAVRLGPKLVGLLAVLVMEAGRPLPGSRLIDVLWSPEPIGAADATLRSHISHLRRRLGLAATSDGGEGDALTAVGTQAGAGYRLDLAPERIDARVFERKLAEGRRFLQLGGDAEIRHAAGLLHEALGLWRGPAFADVADRPFATAEIARLGTLYRSARYAYAEALYATGRYAEVVTELAGAVPEDPYDERLRRLLALALYAEHRVDEAAEVCRDGITRLRQRGLDAPELQRLQRDILTRTLPALTGVTVPRLLPPVPPGCVGRAAELDRARRLLCTATDRPRTLIVMGPAGIGKTSFAIQLSHAVAGHFDGGQLYVNLRGFDPGGSAMPVPEAVRILLTALGVSPKHVPEGLDRQLALYREVLAERRVLIVLDNVRDADQVLPLLPGSPCCAVIATSRSQLASLVSAAWATPLTLDLLSEPEARQMLRLRLGSEATDAEPAAVAEIIEHCARLPLTLAVAAARAATYPAFSLASLAAELRDPGNRLDAFLSADASVDVRTVFSWSYHTLSHPAARLFRLLALHPGPDVTIRAAAGLAGVEPPEARRHLAELTNAHLVTEHLPGRFAFHDMLRAYATDLGDRHGDPGHERSSARRRLLDYYLHAASAAALLVNPHPQDPVPPVPAAPGVPAEEHDDRDRAIAWFAAERAVLMAVVRLAASPAAGAPAHAFRITRAMVDFLERRGHWHDWLDLERTALNLARRLDDPVERARAHRQLGVALARLGRNEDAERELRRALELFGACADRSGRAHTHHNLAWLLGVVGRHREARTHAYHAFHLFRALDDPVGLGRAINAIGWCCAKLGRPAQAVEHCRAAIELLHAGGDRVGEALTWDSLGYAYHVGAEHPQAIAAYRRTVEIYQAIGDRHREATALERLGDVYQSTGDTATACRLWERAAVSLGALGHGMADGIRAKLGARSPVGQAAARSPVGQAAARSPVGQAGGE